MSYPNSPLHTDIPVKLDGVKAVFSIAALSFDGDLPASIFHLELINGDIADWGATSEVVAVFHTDARSSRSNGRRALAKQSGPAHPLPQA